MWARVDAAANSVSAEIINPQSVTVGDTTHPSQIFSAWSNTALKDIGVYTMTVEDVDSNVYNINWSSITYTIDNDAGTVIKHPAKSGKDLAQAKTDLSIEVNERAYTLLLQSDWQILKAYETSINANTANVAVSQSLLNYRESVRSVSDGKITAINAMTDIANCVNYSTSTGWPSTDSLPSTTISNDRLLEAEKNRINTILEKRRAIFSE